MSSRDLVLNEMKRRMERAFVAGNVANAQHYESWVTTFESMDGKHFAPSPEPASVAA